MSEQLGIITHTGLHDLIDQGVIHAAGLNLHAQVNPASINVTLQGSFLIEQSNMKRRDGHNLLPLRFSERESAEFLQLRDSVYLEPGAFCLAAIQEGLNLPRDICASVVLRSSAARFGLDHGYAGFADPGYVGHLTLELKNFLQHNTLKLIGGDQIAQLIFTRVEPVPVGECYSFKGAKYNGDMGPQPIKKELK